MISSSQALNLIYLTKYETLKMEVKSHGKAIRLSKMQCPTGLVTSTMGNARIHVPMWLRGSGLQYRSRQNMELCLPTKRKVAYPEAKELLVSGDIGHERETEKAPRALFKQLLQYEAGLLSRHGLRQAIWNKVGILSTIITHTLQSFLSKSTGASN